MTPYVSLFYTIVKCNSTIKVNKARVTIKVQNIDSLKNISKAK